MNTRVLKILTVFLVSIFSVIFIFKQRHHNDKIIYMDYQATTPVDKRVLLSMLPYLIKHYANPSSKIHSEGRLAMKAVEDSKIKVARLINAQPDEIIFTSGATESDNMAIRGVMKDCNGKKNHIITVATEHPAVIDTVEFLRKKGCQVTVLDVKNDGVLDLDLLRNSIKNNTAVVSVMAVNNLNGVIQSVEEIGKITRAKGIIFHTDAAQAFGKIPIDVEKMNIDMMSISGHKIYAPKGIGAIYIKKSLQSEIEPLIYGGGQQNKLRSGTLATYLIVALGKASDLAGKEMKITNEKLKKLHDMLVNGIKKIEPRASLVGNPSQKYFGCAKVSFPNTDRAQDFFDLMPNIMISSTSACSSGFDTLHSVGDTQNRTVQKHNNVELRFGMGKFTTENEVKLVLKSLEKAIKIIESNQK